jgi:hypothetical protein
LIGIINSIEKKCEQNTDDFQFYYNELLILNNAALFSSKEQSAFFLPYNALGYYVTSDKKTCNEQQHYFINQLSNSKSLNQSGKKDRKIFFNRMYQKINFYKDKIENTLHSQYKIYQHFPNISFEGQTECFTTELPVQEIISYLDSI